MDTSYWTNQSIRREILRWALAVRRQLDEVEELHARWSVSWDKGEARAKGIEYELPDGVHLSDAGVWELETARNFLLISASQFLKALKLAAKHDAFDPPEFRTTLGDELKETRDLTEHWVENAPVFNQVPRPAIPSRSSGRRFAERNPDSGPYDFISWNSVSGVMITPHVSAEELRVLVDDVVSTFEILDDGTWARFIIESRPPAFVRDGNRGWWPARRFLSE